MKPLTTITMKQEKEVGYYDPTPKKETLKQIAEKFAKGVDGVIVKETKTLTSQEKAEELVARYDVLQTFIENFNYHHAKECAIIAVDEIQKTTGIYVNDVEYDYWEQVKEEINVL